MALVLTIAVFVGCESREDISQSSPTTAKSKAKAKNERVQKNLSGTAKPTPKSPPKSPSVEQLLGNAAQALQQNQLDSAWEIIKEVLIRDEHNIQAQFLAVAILRTRGEDLAALEMLRVIETDDPQGQIVIDAQMAELMLGLGMLSEAEVKLLSLQQRLPNDPNPLRMLQTLYNAQGRRFESEKYTRALVELGDFQAIELALMCSIETHFREPKIRAAMETQESSTVFRLIYDARERLLEQNYAKVKELLSEAVRIDPSNVEASVWLGYAQVKLGEHEQLPNWIAQRPAAAEKHPQFWNCLGVWYGQQDQSEASVQAFAKALELDPRSLIATEGIAEGLIYLKHDALASEFRKRAFLIGRLNEEVQDTLRGNLTTESCHSLANSYELLELLSQAKGWRMLGDSLRKSGSSKTPAYSGVMPILADNGSKVSETDRLPLTMFLSQVASFNLQPINLADFGQTVRQASSPSMPTSDFKFANVAKDLGLEEAEYDWGRLASETGVYNYRGMGGGVAVIDYDCDGWQDLYFSRAGATPQDSTLNKPKQLFCWRGDQFVEISDRAGLLDRGYGQGVFAGDFNQDGLADLLVANVRSCRLYENCGDGTFVLSHDVELPADKYWVSTCAIVDVTRDQLPELVLGIYLCGTEHESAKCPRLTSQTYTCPPRRYPGGGVLVYQYAADANDWKLIELLNGVHDEGRPLGLLIGDIDQSSGNDIFVANDQTANHYFNSTLSESAPYRQESGAIGIAVAPNGRPQGSMGVAAADVDHNGLDDVFVTNYFGEANALYQQIRPGLFVDRTDKWKLGTDSIPLVGFGCQFIDFENDSWQDIICVNGHIEDFREFDELFHMPPLVYHNVSSSMSLLPNDVLGVYGTEMTLGRGIATFDLDRDLRQDVVVTHCDRNAALLRNETQSAHHALELLLVGVQSERDGYGSYVEISQGENRWVESSIAGEGYYSSSDRAIHIGLGQERSLVDATIHWPSGLQQKLRDLPGDQRYLVVEGREPAILD